MNLPIANCQLPIANCLEGRGSWSQCAVDKPWRPPMNRLRQRLVTCHLSLVTGDLQRSGPSVSQFPVTSYQLPVTSLVGVHESRWLMVRMKKKAGLEAAHERRS